MFLKATAMIQIKAFDATKENADKIPDFFGAEAIKQQMLDTALKTLVDNMKMQFANVEQDRIIETLQNLGLDLPNERWTDWTKSAFGDCNCREEESCCETKISLHLMRGNAAMISSRRPEADFLPPELDGIE